MSRGWETRRAHLRQRANLHFTGLQHFSGPFPPEKGWGDLHGQQPESPLPIKYFWRAMIADMDAWLATHPSAAKQLSRIADRNLVPLRAYAFPKCRE